MKKLTRTICLSLAVLLGTTGTSWSWSAEKGLAAYQSGDYATALREWRPLAEQGNVRAQHNLGVLYMNGHGVPQDHKTAVKWYTLAAEQGLAKSQASLAAAYAMGRGVLEDYVYAHMWGHIAASNGDEDGREVRGIVAKYMTPSELAKAQELARNFVPRKTTAKKRGSTGTGFFINNQGHIVTNSHVVKDCKKINTLYQGSKVSTSLVTNDPRNDLALLKASTRPSTIAYFRSGRGIRAGEDILAFGFPFKSVLSDELKGTKGMINALSGLNNDTRFMQMSAPVQPGNSGGPLLDQAGNVVGVVTAKMNAIKMAEYSGDIPQNVNFALKASLVRDMLEVKDIDYETASSKRELKTVDIFDRAKKFTVLVECLQ